MPVSHATPPLDQLGVVFDDTHAVASAGLLLPATLAGRLGIQQTADQLIDLGQRPGTAHPGAKLLTQYRDRMSQHESLGVVGRLAAGEQAKPADELTEDQTKESERHGWRSSRASAASAKPQVNPMEEVFGTHRLRVAITPLV